MSGIASAIAGRSSRRGATPDANPGLVEMTIA
jgi:hypothetical protein